VKQKCVRGVTFQLVQLVQVAGRLENFDPATDRYTLTECRQDIIDQSGIFRPEDIIPVSCNPEALAMAYALKVDGEAFPLTRYIDPSDLLDNSRNTIFYEKDQGLHQHMIQLLVREIRWRGLLLKNYRKLCAVCLKFKCLTV